MINIRPICNAGLIGRGLMLGVLILGADVQAQYLNTVIASNLFEPTGVTTDSNNNAYLTDSSNNRLIKLVPTSGSVTALAGVASPTHPGHRNGLGAEALFSQPLGIVFSGGTLTVVDSGNQVLRSVTLTGLVSDLAGTVGAVGFVDGPAASAQFAFPTGIAADPAGNLYIADTGNNAIRRLSTGQVVSTIQVTNYTFGNPTALAVDNANNLWIADTRNDVICVISNITQISNQTVTVIAGIPGSAGTNDSLLASEAQFNYPSGILAITNDNSILISDTGNHTLRRLYLGTDLGPTNYAVSTLAGIPGVAGNVNGALGVAEFGAPAGMSPDLFDQGFYVVDTANSSLRVLQTTAPQPPVQTPQIGFITATTSQTGGLTAQFNPLPNGSGITFNNQATIAIVADTMSQTFVTNVTTSSDPFSQVSPEPGPGWGTATLYNSQDDQYPPPAGEVTLEPTPGTPTNVTVYIYSAAAGRASSIVVSNQFRFIASAPTVEGENGASVVLMDVTTNPIANMYYTLDGTTPTQSSFGPITNGQPLPPITSNALLTVIAFADGFAPSPPVSTFLSVSNFIGNEMTFGFASGEASSEFIASAGQTFYAPVTLSLLPQVTMYSLQMNLFATNLTAPALDPTTLRFDSFLKQPVTINGQTFLAPIYPLIVTDTGFSTGTFTNLSENLLGVSWIERYPETNLYPSTAQSLISFSEAHDIELFEAGGNIEVGSFSFRIPASAANGQTYQIELGSPSATTYFPPAENPVGVLVSSVTSGSLSNGPINSVKDITVGSAQYLVGDGYPFRWFNAGDFGDGVLQNDDVIEVFQSAVYFLDTPPNTSDYFNVLDSCNGNTNDLFNGNDTSINSISMGDGVLAVDDVYVTLRRSLDPALTNYARFWSNGVLNAVAVPTTANLPMARQEGKPKAVSGAQYLTVSADQVAATGSSTLQVPVRVIAPAGYPLRVFMVNIDVTPLDGSPALTSPINFTAVGNLGIPAFVDSQGAGNFAGTWLDSTVAGVTGPGLIGTVNITLPTNATASSAYLVHFTHFSASPNGIALFRSTALDGLVTASDRSGSSWNDGIPDSWRLLYFGSASDPRSAANLDPDGDGASNWQEYVAGTNPLDATSVFELLAAPAGSTGFNLQWPSVVNKTYSVQSSPAFGPATWSTVASNIIGNGQVLQWNDTNSAAANFYRAQVQ